MSRHTPLLSALALPALALSTLLAACGGGGKDPAAPGTPASTPPAAITGVCNIVRVTPEPSVTDGFVDPLMTLVYTASQPGGCDDFVLVDSTQAVVPTAVATASERQFPGGGIVGTRSIEPVAPLMPHAHYALRLNGKEASSFSTGVGRRGDLVDVVDQPVKLPPLPETASIDPSDINGILGSFAKRLAKDKPLETELLKTLLRRELPNLAKPDAKFAARVSKLTYRSADARGNPITLSGLLVAPEQVPGGTPLNFQGMPLVIGQRGATDSTRDAPSSGGNIMMIPGLVAAGKGHVFLAPDLVGLGDTASLPQAYLVAPETAAQTQDMLRAVRAFFLKQHLATLGQDLRVFGSSQGGYSSIAALPLLSREGTVRLVSGGDGPYDVYRTFHGPLLAAAGEARDAFALNEDLRFLPSHVRDVMASFQAYGKFAFDPNAVFAADGSFLPAFLQSYKDGQQKDFVTQLVANSLAGTTVVYKLPQAQLQLYHFSGDTLVPSQNTTNLLAELSDGRHQFAGLQRGDCHESSELVKLVISLSSDVSRTHTICVPFQLNDFVGAL
jgi:hypothetical protein